MLSLSHSLSLSLSVSLRVRERGRQRERGNEKEREICRILLFSTSVFHLLVVIFAWKWCGADPTRWARQFVSSVMTISRLYFHPPRAGPPSPEPMGTRAHVRDSTAGFTRL